MSTSGWIILSILVALSVAGTIWVCRNPSSMMFIDNRVDEARLLEMWINEKARKDPAWDRECRRESCICALGRGVSAETLRQVYPDVIDEALAEVGKGNG